MILLHDTSSLMIWNRLRRWRFFSVISLCSFLLVIPFLIPCTSIASDKPSTTTATVSFDKEILPVFKEKCLRCHGGKTRKADLDLSSMKSVIKGGESGEGIDFHEPEESLLYEYIHEDVMPPEEESPLNQNEKDLILKWVLETGKSKSSPEQENKSISQHDVIPVLMLHCAVCHGAQRQEAGLDIRSKSSLLKGGKSGPAIVLGKPEESLLLKQIHDEKMPPREKLAYVSVKVMTPEETELVSDWILEGAPEIEMVPDVASTEPDPLVSDQDRQFWAFQSPRDPDLSKVKNQSLVKTPIDLFIQQKLEEKNLEMAPLANKETLIRRASLDLIGLPPAPERVIAFLEDNDPKAYEKLLDELLASPRYGERWGQYWLDLAGYSDSEGGQNADYHRENTWRYRDYVIRSFNSDKPYSRFILEQIAGDELAEYNLSKEPSQEIKDNLIATGFLRMAPDGTFAPITGFINDRLNVVHDEIEIFSSAILGLTMKCARCHTHKFDPIPQRDYYRLTAIFKGAYDENDWIPPNEKGGHLHKNALIRTLSFPDNTKPKDKTNLTIRALWDRGQPTNTYIMVRGDYRKRGKLVGPGVPSVLTDGKTPFEVSPPWENANKTGRRLALAKWLIDPGNPLTSRVMVNRIWKHHFAEGIVKTLDNFGKTGARPTHPELLDWLAIRFINENWSIKSLHRLIMTSHVYQQESVTTPEKNRLDPENNLLSRMPLKRMDAEVIRDSLLQVAGLLDLTPYGPADPIDVRQDGLVTSGKKNGENWKWRRSIYQLKRRTQPITILQNFDAPRMNPNCIMRSESIVAPQALHLLNNKMVKELTDALAIRIREESGNNLQNQIERVYQVCLGRNPTSQERELALKNMQDLIIAWEKQELRETRSLRATTHLWIRENTPDQVYEDDLVSVWSSSSSDKARRWGVIEFDLKNLTPNEIHDITLKLGPTNQAIISQNAFLISPGIEKLTWSQYLAEKANSEVSLASFGQIKVEDSTQIIPGNFFSSSHATEEDLDRIKSAIANHQKLTLVFKAEENGTPYSQDWDDGVHKNTKETPPEIVITGNPLSEIELQEKSLQIFCHALVNSAAFLFIN